MSDRRKGTRDRRKSRSITWVSVGGGSSVPAPDNGGRRRDLKTREWFRDAGIRYTETYVRANYRLLREGDAQFVWEGMRIALRRKEEK